MLRSVGDLNTADLSDIKKLPDPPSFEKPLTNPTIPANVTRMKTAKSFLIPTKSPDVSIVLVTDADDGGDVGGSAMLGKS